MALAEVSGPCRSRSLSGVLSSSESMRTLRRAGRGAADMAAWQQAASVLAALVQALLTVEGPEGVPDEADEQRLSTPACVPTMHLTPASTDPRLGSPSQ